MTSINDIKVGDRLPERVFTPTNVSLFLYNAAIWNAHRIHYDENYAIGVEGHPGIVIDGPLQGDWLTQLAVEWMDGDGELVVFEYANRKACYLGDTLTSGGVVTAVDTARREATLEIFIKDDHGDITSPGSAVVRFKE
jgi:hydroxyacyl-ACP dehydratase HTD2-like protein with hotdog domain